MTGGVSATTLVSIGVAMASAAVSAVGSIEQGQAQAQQAKYQAAVARNNQTIAQQNAQDALDRGAEQEQEQRKKTQFLIGQQRASLAAQGADLSSGTSLDLVSDIAGTGELDALTIRRNAQLEARQYQVQGMNYQADSQLQLLGGQDALTSSYFDAGSSLLSSASSLAGKFDFSSPPPSYRVGTKNTVTGMLGAI